MGDKVEKLEEKINLMKEELHDNKTILQNWSTWRMAPGEIT